MIEIFGVVAIGIICALLVYLILHAIMMGAGYHRYLVILSRTNILPRTRRQLIGDTLRNVRHWYSWGTIYVVGNYDVPKDIRKPVVRRNR